MKIKIQNLGLKYVVSCEVILTFKGAGAYRGNLVEQIILNCFIQGSTMEMEVYFN
jgi:hypothetical protein